MAYIALNEYEYCGDWKYDNLFHSQKSNKTKPSYD